MRPTGHRTRPRGHRPAPIDPLAPLSEKALRRQTTRDVQAQIAPLAALINKRALAGASNISGISQALASKLGSYAGQAQGIYSKAQTELGGVDQALAARLGAGGLGGAANAGAVNANLAKGSAERGQLISQGASAGEYASKLPGLAQLAGLQGVSERQAQAQGQLGDLTAKTPGLIAQALADARNREYQKAVARLGFQGDVYSANLGYKARAASTAETARGHDLAYEAKLKSISAANARTGMTLQERARHNNVTEQEQARRDAEHAQNDRERARHNQKTEHQQRKNEIGRERRSKRSAKKKKSGNSDNPSQLGK